MRFDFLFIAALAAVLTSAYAQQCPEALRFGALTVSPTTVIPGQTFTITTNLTCAVKLDDTPTYLDYYIVGVSTTILNGPILLARRTYNNSTSPPIDTFLARIPVWIYDPNGGYSVSVSNSFARLGPTGESVISVGSISTGINIITGTL
ncbi:hypothetical protein DFH09DRAFT_1280915 [Mycena vulgaris]|nr:hypothetical protein DFH09DRAFT_1280915 [Mycena vulgaris]